MIKDLSDNRKISAKELAAQMINNDLDELLSSWENVFNVSELTDREKNLVTDQLGKYAKRIKKVLRIGGQTEDDGDESDSNTTNTLGD